MAVNLALSRRPRRQFGSKIVKEANDFIFNSLNWAFRHHDFSCHHQQFNVVETSSFKTYCGFLFSLKFFCLIFIVLETISIVLEVSE